MMEVLGSQVAAAVMVLSIVLGPALLGVWFILWRKGKSRQERRSPLTKELLRTPGHRLREQLEDSRVDIAFDIALLTTIPGMLLSMQYASALVTGKMPSGFVLGIVLIGVVTISAYQVFRLVRRTAELDQFRLGLDAELAVGQELDQLMRKGAVVFHDMPCEKFNIDHIVISPQGVFAIETKGYRKPNRAGGTADATVVFDGESLQFPDWSSAKPLAQAQRQAEWLAGWLSGATAERTEVTPVLALPGWFIKRKGRGRVMVLSGPDLQKHLLKARDAQPLSSEQMERVVHQVEQRCRNVKPTYRPESDDD